MIILTRVSLRATQPTSALTIAATGELATEPQTLASVRRVGSIVMMMVVMIVMMVMMIQGVFLTGTPPKDSKYKKVNLG